MQAVNRQQPPGLGQIPAAAEGLSQVSGRAGIRPGPQVPPSGSRSSPGTGRFSSWRTVGSPERPSGWRAGWWPDPVPEGQQGRRETGYRYQVNGRRWNRQHRAGLGEMPPAAGGILREAGRVAAGPISGTPSDSSSAPGKMQFSRWRTAGSREPLSGWRVTQVLLTKGFNFLEY